MAVPLQLREYKIQLTMNYEGKHGNKGFSPSPDTFVHDVFVHTSGSDRDVSDESMPTGSIPLSVVHGIKIPIVNITGYFPYSFPDDFFTKFMPTLAPYRTSTGNTVKNIFLVGTILEVVSNGNGLFYELPVSTRWYVKNYTWVRNMSHPDRGEFQLQLMQWFKEISI